MITFPVLQHHPMDGNPSDSRCRPPLWRSPSKNNLRIFQHTPETYPLGVSPAHQQWKVKVYRGPFVKMNRFLFHCWWVGDTPETYPGPESLTVYVSEVLNH